jgi:thymidylate synthase
LYNKRRGVGEIDTNYSIGTIIAKDPSIPRRTISLLWNQRSVDVGLGLPFNIASYALLLEIIAKQVNMIPEEVIGNLGDCHIYLNHVDGLKEQLTRVPYELPTLNVNENNKLRIGGGVFTYDVKDFTLENYQCHPKIKMPLSN